ncbi:MAG: hypothetical protein ABI147_14010 [Acidobacteriaceae bacterium]
MRNLWIMIFLCLCTVHPQASEPAGGGTLSVTVKDLTGASLAHAAIHV